MSSGCTVSDGGTISSRGHNIDSGASCGFTSTGDLQDTDPLLAPLADNGGPTQTMALLPGSPAINAGDTATCEPTDQRGYVRPGTGFANCSVGAYEYNSPGPPCAGDCVGNREVTVEQILTMVNIALGNADLSTCRWGDVNEDGQVTVDEVLAAVDNALNGCADAAGVVAGV